jgi:hypothetical protein
MGCFFDFISHFVDFQGNISLQFDIFPDAIHFANVSAEIIFFPIPSNDMEASQ